MKVFFIYVFLVFFTYIVIWHIIPYYQLPDNLDKIEAIKILNKQKQIYYNESYSKLSDLIDNDSITFIITAESGIEYQIEVQSFWYNDEKNGDLLVMIGIDNGYRSAYHPMTDIFIKKRNNDYLLDW